MADLFFREIFRLHGLPKNIVSDKDSRFISLFSQELFRLTHTKLTPSNSYHPQTDAQMEIMNKWIEGYLRNYATGQQTVWIKWLHLGEFCYNTTQHMSIGMLPFKALYGYEATSLMDLLLTNSRVSRAKDVIQESMDILHSLKENLQQAQNQQKMYADRHRTERVFGVDDMVYVRLQPYRKSTLNGNGVEKLKLRFYGPYKVLRRIGEVAYELELPQGSKIYKKFHVSCLKGALGQQVTPSTKLPPLNDEGKLILEPETMLDVREKRLRNKIIPKYLVKWKNLPIEDTTWEGVEIFKHLNLQLLEGKQHLSREDCHVPTHD